MKKQVKIKIKKHKKDHVGFDHGFNAGKKKAFVQSFEGVLSHSISSSMFSVVMILSYLQINGNFLLVSINF